MNDPSLRKASPVAPSIFGGLCAAAGAGIGGWHAATAAGEDWWLLGVTAPLGSFLCGYAIWRVWSGRISRTGRGFGAVAGMLTSVAAQFVAWYLVILSLFLCNVLTGGCMGSVGSERPLGPIGGILGAAAFTGWSLVLRGWITLPLGAAIGFFCTRKECEKMADDVGTGP